RSTCRRVGGWCGRRSSARTTGPPCSTSRARRTECPTESRPSAPASLAKSFRGRLPSRHRASSPERRQLGVSEQTLDPPSAASPETRRARLAALLKARAAEPAVRPLSFAQQQLWFLEQLTPGTALWNVPAALRVTAPLVVPALERALAEIVTRHESLRTT